MPFFRPFRGITRNGDTSNYFLALDIGTDAVKALVCEAEGEKGRVLGVGKEKQKLGDMQGGVVTDIASVITNCTKAIKQAEKMAGVKTSRMILGISGELVKGTTNTTTYIRRDSESKIDMSELKNIVHKVQWRAFDIARSQMAKDTGYSEIDVKLVNAAIVDTRIDGYKVTNPIGFQGKEVTLSIFNAFAPLVHFGALQTIAVEIDKELLAIAAEPYALSRCLGYEDGSDFGAIFIDVGAGTTDIAVVRDGSLEGTRMFTLGGRMFTKRLAQSLNVSFKEAEEIKNNYSNDKLERQSHKIVRESMKTDSDVWLSGVVLTLEEFEDVDVLPSKIILSGGGANLPEIKEALETREWSKGLRFSKKPQVSLLDPKLISNLSDETKTLNSQEDAVPMALANLALGFLAEEALPSKVLKKVVRLMQI